MKVVFISHDADLIGGAQWCLLDLLKGLREKRSELEIYVVFPKEGGLIDACLPYINGHKIIKQPFWLSFSTKKKSKIALCRKIIKASFLNFCYFKRIKPDYVVTNTLAIPSGALGAKLGGYKHVWFVHEVPSDTEHMSFVFGEKSVMLLVDRLSVKLVVPSDYAKFYYNNKCSILLYKIVRIWQAVEIEGQSNNICRQDYRYTLAMIGSFDPNKGQLELLEAIKELCVKGLDLHCYLVGSDDGSYSQLVSEYVESHCLKQHVTIIPYTMTPLNYFYLSDVALVCSKSESFGRVTVEALKCGIPVIASNVGANPELIQDGYNGLLYKKGDYKDLAQKIELLNDFALREKFNKNFKLSIHKRFVRKQFASDFLSFVLS